MPGAETKSSFLGGISPWVSSRSTTPQPGAADPGNRREALQRTHGKDHTISHRQRLSLLRYPEDCPPIQPRWFYAVDTPKFKPAVVGPEKRESKPLPPPKKFVPFSSRDSQCVEAAFQQQLRYEDSNHAAGIRDRTKGETKGTVKVPVNEDYLFDVDVDKRELSPVYWPGPVYEVRRGTWFFQEGSALKPCEENLATQLEEGYLKVKPWQAQDKHSRANLGTSSTHETGRALSLPSSDPDTVVSEHAYTASFSEGGGDIPSSEPPVYRLFGAYMNSTVTYQDSSIAWLNHDDFMSRMSSTVYQRFGGVGGTKVIRGYSEPRQPKEAMETRGSEPRPSQQLKSREDPHRKHTEDDPRRLKRRSAPDSFSSSTLSVEEFEDEHTLSNSSKQRATLQRQMSSLTGETGDTAVLEEEARKQEEKEMEDSREADDEERGREIDHLVLVTHGIGQRLGLRLESINFVHDVNVLRKTMKSVYGASPDLQALNTSFADCKKNCRVQVLPVCWRHLLDFPRQGLRQNREGLDLADPNSLGSEDEYPSLSDITLEGVPAVRNLISDLAMDVLLYQSVYREHIMDIVQQECNRIFKLFKSRNPSFQGSVSLCGHSLGSAIMFDILCCQQRRSVNDPRPAPAMKDGKSETLLKEPNTYPLDFDCQEFFCLGSPISLFQMLKAKTIVGRSIIERNFTQSKTSFTDHELLTGSMQLPNHTGNAHGRHSLYEIPASVSSPKCEQLYNIFHPSDPVSYRLEPLISPAMTALKPQHLPSVKKSIWTTSGQSLSNISSRVGSIWTNFTSGVASSLLNRSLGLHSEDSAPSGSAIPRSEQAQPGTISENSDGKESHTFRNGNVKAANEHFQALIDPDLETLYEGFQKARHDHKSIPGGFDNSMELLEAEERAKKLKIEEAKVRALNSNGRVDYSIQEGAFDISLIASIASHLSYWADEDVNHFMLSQMLLRMRRGRHR